MLLWKLRCASTSIAWLSATAELLVCHELFSVSFLRQRVKYFCIISYLNKCIGRQLMYGQNRALLRYFGIAVFPTARISDIALL